MDQRLKERLIGAVVLVALAVWLIPWLLDGPEREAGTETVALNLPAAEEAAPKKTVTIDLDDRGRPAVPAENAAPVAETSRAEAEVEAEPESEPRPAAADSELVAASAGSETRDESESTVPASAEDAGETEAAETEATQTSAAPEAGTAAPEAETSSAEPAASGGWAVQLGSFGEAGNAERLAERVETFGYEPEVSTYRSSGRDLHRVRVGPQPSRARAEAVASALTAHGFVAQVVTAD